MQIHLYGPFTDEQLNRVLAIVEKQNDAALSAHESTHSLIHDGIGHIVRHIEGMMAPESPDALRTGGADPNQKPTFAGTPSGAPVR